jgi:hypothetical protein
MKMGGPHAGICGVQYAKETVEKARSANRALFARFEKNPVPMPPEGHVQPKHKEFLDRVLRRHRALSFPR